MHSILDGHELVTRSPHPFFANPAIRAKETIRNMMTYNARTTSQEEDNSVEHKGKIICA